MRLFAGDVIPDLRIVAPALPGPWMLPNGIGRAHRNRLVRVLHQALQGGEPGLRLVDIRWGDRGFVAQGRFKLPSPALLRWRIEPLPGVDRAAVMREGHRIGPKFAVFDFGQIPGDETLAWLGPLKLEVLRRIIDALADHPPVDAADSVIERLQDLASYVRSPVDLIDAAEVMSTMITRGQTVRSSHAEACALLIAGRFADEDRDRDAAEMIRALVRAGRDEDITAESRRLLERVGLMGPDSGRLLPLLELLRVDDVMPRTQRLLVARFPLRETIPELTLDRARPDLVIGARLAAQVLRKPVIGKAMHGMQIEQVEGIEPDELKPDVSAALHAAAIRWRRGDRQGAATLVLDDIQNGRADGWSDKECRMAGLLLLHAAQHVYTTLPDDSPMLAVLRIWLNESANAFTRAGEIRWVAAALGLAGAISVDLDDLDQAEMFLNLGQSLTEQVDDQALLIMIHMSLGRVMFCSERFVESRREYDTALAFAHKTGERRAQAEVYLALGELHRETHNGEEARRSIVAARDLYREMGDAASQAQALMLLATLYSEQLDTGAAIRNVTEAIEVGPRDDNSLAIWAHILLGSLRAYKDDWTEARREFNRAQRRLLDDSHATDHDIAFNALGALELELGEFSKARSMYEAALTASRVNGKIDGEAEALNGIGTALRHLGDLEGSLEAHKEALDLADPDAPGQRIRALFSLGELSVWLGDLDSSLRAFEETLSLSRQEHLREQEIRSLLCLSSVLIAKGQDAHEQIGACIRHTDSIDYRLLREFCRVLKAAQAWAADPGAARAEWTQVADYFKKSRRTAKAAQTHALIAVVDERPFDEIAEQLEQVLGTIHPLPDRVRAADTAEAALRAIIPFTTT